MNFRDQLFSKNGQAVISLSKTLLQYAIGEKMPTVTALCEKFGFARGTVQNALKTLQSSKAIQVESRGHMGSYITKKNTKILLQYAGVTSLVGGMPLPYSKKYEGLATGLITATENVYNIPITLSFMRGSVNRISMVLSNRYDFAIVSKYAALEFLKKQKTIQIVKSFGVGSYCSAHAIIFHDPSVFQIQDGMRIGIDMDSIDQSNMVKKACSGKNVIFVPVEYSTLLSRVMAGSIDATVWNKDEITDKLAKIEYKEIHDENEEDTEAVMITSNKVPEIGMLLSEIISKETVLNIQKLVQQGKITPNY